MQPSDFSMLRHGTTLFRGRGRFFDGPANFSTREIRRGDGQILFCDTGRERLDSLLRRSKRLDYCSGDMPVISDLEHEGSGPRTSVSF